MRQLLLCLMLTSFAGCTADGGDHTSRDSLDWAGTYRGILPCADCPGIDITLAIAETGTYVLTTTYLGEGGRQFSSSGKFEWQQNGSTIKLDVDQGPRVYRVEENRLRQLDLEGKPIESALADKYVLVKEPR